MRPGRDTGGKSFMKKLWMRLSAVLILALAVLVFAKTEAKAAPVVTPDGTVFDPEFYANTYADLKGFYGYNAGALYKHYVNHGRAEGRIPTGSYDAVGSVNIMPNGDFFSASYYAANNPDVVASVGDSEAALYQHYLQFGKKEGRQAYPGEITFKNLNAQINTNTKYPYYIRINRAAATITVYAMDAEGNYSIPYLAYACSPGRDTPIGVFQIQQKARWLAFEGNQFGQYTSRITGHFWFHSVMYNGKSPSNLDWPAYNRLGTICSHGCVRMQCGEAYWIYQNCPVGTTVEIYDDPTNPGPLGKPDTMKISGADPRRGWDPTDPDPANPWNVVSTP